MISRASQTCRNALSRTLLVYHLHLNQLAVGSMISEVILNDAALLGCEVAHVYIVVTQINRGLCDEAWSTPWTRLVCCIVYELFHFSALRVGNHNITQWH